MEIDEWLRKVLGVVADIGDREFQERVWIRGEGPEVSSFDEIMCTLFDDSQLDALIDECRSLGLHKEGIDGLAGLRDALNAYPDREDRSSDAEIVRDPKWIEITERANEVLARFPFKREELTY